MIRSDSAHPPTGLAAQGPDSSVAPTHPLAGSVGATGSGAGRHAGGTLKTGLNSQLLNQLRQGFTPSRVLGLVTGPKRVLWPNQIQAPKGDSHPLVVGGTS